MIQVSKETSLLTVKEFHKLLGEDVSLAQAKNLLYFLKRKGLAKREARIIGGNEGRPPNVWRVPKCVTINLG